jgi:hypothetical protein
MVGMADRKNDLYPSDRAIRFPLGVPQVPEPDTPEPVFAIITLYTKFYRPHKSMVMKATAFAPIVGPRQNGRDNFAFPIRRIF